MTRDRVILGLLVLVVACIACFTRVAQHRRVELVGRAGWITTDPDTQYQIRRVERALDQGLPPAEFDERMNAPHGARIPWPPYYAALATALVAPFAPSADRGAWLEPAVASLACVFSVAGSVLAALAARRLAGNGAAWVAGVMHATCGASIAYGKLGNGDHHAFVSLLAGALLFTMSCAFEERALASRARALALGLASGTLAGLALGAWVASLMYVVEVQLALAVLLVLHSRRALPGTALLGISFHLAALAAVLPAVSSSPWKLDQPWIVVNLSWFHPAYLALGACVFVPLLVLREHSRASRAWPWLVALLVVASGAWIALSDAGPARGVREGFEWVSRVDSFMARVGESRPLIGAGAGDDVFEALGFLVLAVPFAWGALLWAARRGDLRLVPWVVAFPLLAAQAARQARFAEALALPLAVVIGWGFARLAEALCARLRWKRDLAPVVGVAVVLVAAWPTMALTARRLEAGADAARFERPGVLGARLACEWLAQVPALEAGESVMAEWSHGHLIERVAGRASVGTNFGSYVGIEAFRDSQRFFLLEDFAELDALLAARHARFVLVDCDLPNSLNTQLDALDGSQRERYVSVGSEHGGSVQPAWFLTLGARAMFDGTVFGPLAPGSRPLERLRCVWVAPFQSPERRLRGPHDFAPAAWVWERVAGALVEARGVAGESFELALELEFRDARRRLVWSDRTAVDALGRARLRVPYATDLPNGQGQPVGHAQWRLGSAHGALEIPESAVRSGAVLQLP
ncbi:MAG: hypothetical protein IT454_06150 [Planctomycetes bacterium]|nr:hypothetical protein [Planctomycetota bacterium]